VKVLNGEVKLEAPGHSVDMKKEDLHTDNGLVLAHSKHRQWWRSSAVGQSFPILWCTSLCFCDSI
jgi:hypothetical protein